MNKSSTEAIQLGSMHALDLLNKSISELTLRVEILTDERDEYRRKWLNATKLDKQNKLQVGIEK